MKMFVESKKNHKFDNLIAELKKELLNKIETDPEKNQFGNYKIGLYDR
mgnify:CR=1 FL=1